MKKTLKGTFYLALFAVSLVVASPASAIVCGCFCETSVPTRPCSYPNDPAIHNCGDFLYYYGYTCSLSASTAQETAPQPSFLVPDSQGEEGCAATPAPADPLC